MNTSKQMKNIKWYQDIPNNEFYYDVNLFDIAETVYKAILNLPDNCRAISINSEIGIEATKCAEKAAQMRGIKIVWK